MRFSIVIPTYNRIQTLQQTLEAVTRQTYDNYEVVVVDDGSSDGTADLIPRRYLSIRFIRQTNRGPAAARNVGSHAAEGEVIAFTDDDCIPPPDWLARLADGYTRYPHVAGVGGYLEAAREVLARSLFARYEMHVARTLYAVSDHEFVGGFECPAGGTNNMSYRRNVLERAGGFDEAFPHAAGEDADLKWRICATGAQLLYLPMKVEHLQSYAWAAFKRQAYFRGRGRARFEAKHGPPPTRHRVVLRALRRWLNFPRDVLDTKRRPFAVIRLAEAWLNARGEWDMIMDMRTWISST